MFTESPARRQRTRARVARERRTSTLVSYPERDRGVVIILVGIVLGGFVGGIIGASAGAVHGGRAARGSDGGDASLAVFWRCRSLGSPPTS
jgi:hypothetical protein